MCPFEFVAMATASPSVSPAGTFKRFGADVYGISETFCAVALSCARTFGGAATVNATTAASVVSNRLVIQSLLGAPILLRSRREIRAGLSALTRRRSRQEDPVFVSRRISTTAVRSARIIREYV